MYTEGFFFFDYALSLVDVGFLFKCIINSVISVHNYLYLSKAYTE